MQPALKIDEQPAFAAKKMRAAGDVENGAVASILRNQRRVAIAPFDKLRQALGGDIRTEETEKTAQHLIPPTPHV